jgi:hypothetical protein
MAVMSLSRQKINYLSQLIVKALQKAGSVTFLKAENDVRLQIVKTRRWRRVLVAAQTTAE